MRNNYLPYSIGTKSTNQPYSDGVSNIFPIGDLGYKAYLSDQQMADLVNSVRTGRPLQNKIPRNPASMVKSMYSKKQIIDYYNKTRKAVKRDILNSGTVSRAKKAQLPYKLK